MSNATLLKREKADQRDRLGADGVEFNRALSNDNLPSFRTAKLEVELCRAPTSSPKDQLDKWQQQDLPLEFLHRSQSHSQMMRSKCRNEKVPDFVLENR